MDLKEFRKFSYPICQSHKLFNKVFCIGANKTGTTTMKGVFNIIGLRVAPQQEAELAALPFFKGKLGAMKSYIENYDAFQDVPFSIKSTYAQIDSLFPGSKFILTYRNSDEWFESLLAAHKKIF